MKYDLRNEINEELSSVNFVTKERLDRLKAEERHKPMNIRKRIFAISAAAVAAVFATVSVGAATGWDYGRLISGFFHADNEKDIEVQENNERARKLQGLMQQIPEDSVSNTFKNYDVSFDGLIYDGNVLMVSSTIRSKDGTPFIEKGAYDYTTFYKIEGGSIKASGAKEWSEVKEDGSLQACVIYDNVNIPDKEKIKISMNYLLHDSQELKMPKNINDIDPDEVADTGSISAELEVKICKVFRDFVLTNDEGKTINAHVTPLSVKYTFEPYLLDELEAIEFTGVMYSRKYGIIDDKGTVSGVMSGLRTTGDNSGEYGNAKEGFIVYAFAEPIDVEQIDGISDGNYSWGTYAPSADNTVNNITEENPNSYEETIKNLDGLMQYIPSENVNSTFTNYDVNFDGLIFDGRVLMVSSTIRSKDGTPFIPGAVNKYSSFFSLESDEIEGLERHGCSSWSKVRADGSLQTFAVYEDLEITEKTIIKINLNYFLYDYDGLKMPQDISEIDPSVMLDSGTATAEVELNTCEVYRDLTLTNSEGKTVNALVTPISFYFRFENDQLTEQECMRLSGGSDFYDENGELLINRFISGGGSEIGDNGFGYAYKIFQEAIDVNKIYGIKGGDYSWGSIPDNE